MALSIGSAGKPVSGKGALGIHLHGADDIIKALDKLDRSVQNRIARVVLEKSAARTHKRLIRQLSGEPVGIRRGVTRQAYMSDAKIRAGRRSRRSVSVIIRSPSRSSLQISRDDRHYYPHALEYLVYPVRKTIRWIRNSVDNFRGLEGFRISRDFRRTLGVTMSAIQWGKKPTLRVVRGEA